MPDTRQAEDIVRWLRVSVLSLPDRDDPARQAAAEEIAAGLRRHLGRLAADPDAGRSGPLRLSRRLIREVIAPELELYWARKGKDPRP